MPAKPPADAGPGRAPSEKAGKETSKEKPCPICGKPAILAARPFCSGRCRDVDLNRWLSNSYVVPGKDDDEDAE
jgi:endogenous inhibitor of DNA gyrase (YacG/DUF329 family)